ncbi:MAG: NAD(P)/FAD-dependent oxidoreductase [Candidatus Micrarchaeota archaeon]
MKTIVVGAGPAGLFCAYELAKAGLLVEIYERGEEIGKRICPMKHTGFCVKCPECNFIHGVGGNGLYSDGKLNLDPEIGGNLLEFSSEHEAKKLIEQIDDTFTRHGAHSKKTEREDYAELLVARAKANGVRFIPIQQRHMGSDKLPEIIGSFVEELKALGAVFKTRETVTDIIVEENRVKGIMIDGQKIDADYVVIGPGRGGAKWLSGLCAKHGIKARHQAIDIGVRVEVPAEIMNEATAICWDPKFHINTKTHDDLVRTFCTNPRGYVVTEHYGDFVCVNGHSLKGKKSENTNFAFLVRVELTHPVENTTEYGEAIARMATTIGGGKPTIQRLGDLKSGRRSTWERIEKSYVKPTLTEATPGDIAMGLPARIVTDVLEGLEALNRVIPGIYEDSTILYSPEIKFHAHRVEVKKDMETSIEHLFTVGDGAGVSRGIVIAAATGIIAAREIIRRSHTHNHAYNNSANEGG